jgi:excisionase family DNA binding protein
MAKDKQNHVDTKKAADFLGCSTRRVRALLSQGRITGEKVGTEWLIQWPIQCTFGLRAPLRKFSQVGNSKKINASNNESEV